MYSTCPCLFFVYSSLPCNLSRLWQDYVQSVSCPLSARWQHFALRPGLSQEDEVRTKEITKEKRPNERVRQRNKGDRHPRPYSSPADAMKSGVGGTGGNPPPPPPPGRPAPQPLPSAPTPAAPPPAPHSPCPSQPELAFPHLWQRGSPEPPGCTVYRPGGPGSSTGSSTSQSPSTPPPTGSPVGPSTPGTP